MFQLGFTTFTGKKRAVFGMGHFRGDFVSGQVESGANLSTAMRSHARGVGKDGDEAILSVFCALELIDGTEGVGANHWKLLG
jgi:hypothetical protein